LGSLLRAVLETDADQKGAGEQDQGNMAIPAQVATHFIVIEPQGFGGLQVLFDVPAAANGAYDGGERRGQWGKDQVSGDLAGIVEAAPKDEEVAVVEAALVQDGQAGPGKEALAFAAQALREELPVRWAQRLLLDGSDIRQQAALVRLDTDDLERGDRQGVGVALLFQEDPQVRAVA
jgi:hypothetical protein